MQTRYALMILVVTAGTALCSGCGPAPPPASSLEDNSQIPLKVVARTETRVANSNQDIPAIVYMSNDDLSLVKDGYGRVNGGTNKPTGLTVTPSKGQAIASNAPNLKSGFAVAVQIAADSMLGKNKGSGRIDVRFGDGSGTNDGKPAVAMTCTVTAPSSRYPTFVFVCSRPSYTIGSANPRDAREENRL